MAENSTKNKIPIVTLIGRPNVGKSTLFNRLTKSRSAIEAKEAGTTRDWQESKVLNPKGSFQLVDSAGLEKASNELGQNVQQILGQAIEKADLLLWVIDGSFGLTNEDLNWKKKVRSFSKPVWLVINKCDNLERLEQSPEFRKLGFPTIFLISALHNKNIHHLTDSLRSWASQYSRETETPQTDIRFSIIGRPNVGKSSLLNAILAQERVVTSSTPGTTRDSVTVPIIGQEIGWNKAKNLKADFIDTAGLRKKSRIEKGPEYFSSLRVAESINQSDVVLVVLDATTGITKQDLHISGLAFEAKKSIILVVNKWDEAKASGKSNKQLRDDFIKNLQLKASFLRFAPVIFTSTKTSLNIVELKQLMEKAWLDRQKNFSPEELDKLAKSPYYPIMKFIEKIEQIDVNPPTFRVYNLRPLRVYEIRQLKNAIRETFELFATPVEIELN